MVELVDTQRSERCGRKVVEVQVLFRPPKINFCDRIKLILSFIKEGIFSLNYRTISGNGFSA